MSLTQTVRNRLIDAINTTFDAIGVEGESKMPRKRNGDTRLNSAPIAYEYFVSQYLATRARARAEAAKKRAIAADVIFDHINHPRDEGTNEQIYTSDLVNVWVEVKRSSTSVDPDRMSNYLLGKGVSAKLLAEAYEHASSKRRPPHEFKASLVAPVETSAK